MLVDIERAVSNSLSTLGVAESCSEVALPNDPANGDLTSVSALHGAKALGVAPRELAGLLAALLEADKRFERVWVAGPGFVNMTLDEAYLTKQMQDAVSAGARFGKGQGAERFAACYLAGPSSLRQLWSAETAAALAAHLGAEVEVVTEQGNIVAARSCLEAALLTSAAFGRATESELVSLTRQLAVIFEGFNRATSVQFYAEQGADFRPGLFEFVVSPRALSCRGLAALELEDEGCDLSKLFTMAHRADKALRLTPKRLRRAGAENPAYLIQYAYMHARRADQTVPTPPAAHERRLLCKLLSFPAILRLANRLAEPQRIGLFLAEVAREITFGEPSGPERGPKAISPAVLAVADVVFSVGLAILGVQALDEIS